MSKPKSLIGEMVKSAKSVENEKDIFPHVIVGVEADFEGNPMAILSSSLTKGGYIGLGMVESIRQLLDEIEADIRKGFKKTLERNRQHMNEPSIKDAIMKINPIVANIIDSYKFKIVESLESGDTELAKKHKDELFKELNDAGFDIDDVGKIIQDAQNNSKDGNKDEGKDNFDPNDISKYL